MSPRSSEKKPKGTAGTPELDVYVGLLLVALGALITGCIFLALELNNYGWQVAQ